MATFAELVNAQSRRRLERYFREGAEPTDLVEEPGQQRPPDPPPALAELAERTDDDMAD